MATLWTVKADLEQEIPEADRLPLTDEQYRAGLEIFRNGRGRKTYEDIIIPQLKTLVDSLLNARPQISVLEIGPGPASVLGDLPDTQLRKIKRYTAFEPNALFVPLLDQQLRNKDLLPNLQSPPWIRQLSFRATAGATEGPAGKYDLVLFCHSMYGMRPKRAYIERALGMLDNDQAGDGLVVVFHREGVHFDGLVCHRTASFPTGTVSLVPNRASIAAFGQFVAGWAARDQDEEARYLRHVIVESRGRPEGHDLVYRAPEVMVTFTRHATSVPELTSKVPSLASDSTRKMKNSESRLSRAAEVVKPTEISQIQACVRWAIENRVGLTVIGGSHSGHCVVPNVVAIDMSSFNQVHVVPSEAGVSMIIAEAGANAGGIISRAMPAGLTVPLGSRPSVGAGLWLQGGIGHLARMYGLTCDSVIGAVLVGADSGEIVHVGSVPNEFQPAGSSRPSADLERDILWAMEGAGTNFGVVTSVVFSGSPAPTYLIRSWRFFLGALFQSLSEDTGRFDALITRELPPSCSADAYLYKAGDQLALGIKTYQASANVSKDPFPLNTPLSSMSEARLGQLRDMYPLGERSSSAIEDLGPETDIRVVDCNGLFETDLYMPGMCVSNGGGKKSSFKRCVFLKGEGSPLSEEATRKVLFNAMQTSPTDLCYFHLLHGGGTDRAQDIKPGAMAFGCRGWNFACVITGVWLRDQDGSDLSREVRHWVYDVANSLLRLQSCSGVYPADLGPDPRDAALALSAFGPNRPRLARLKKTLDPHNIMAYACPLPKETMEPMLIILVTGQHMVGKDYCAQIWNSVFKVEGKGVPTRSLSISTAMKREYATSVGINLNRLLNDRHYKEEHRPALTAFFEARVRERPHLAEEQFLDCVYSAAEDGVHVLFITGMREEAPVASFAHLVPDSKVIEVHIRASKATMQHRRFDQLHVPMNDDDNSFDITPRTLNHVPDFIFDNNTLGNTNARTFAYKKLVPFVDACYALLDLEGKVRTIPNFPRQGVEFRHILGLTQQPDGLKFTGILKKEFGGNWGDVDAIVACEAGGFLFASALACSLDKPLAIVRKAGKLPPPVVSVAKGQSHISHVSAESSSSGLSGSGSSADDAQDSERIEIERYAIPNPGNASVVVVDDVLASGETLCAVLSLLKEVGVQAERISVMVVAEFPLHRGRKVLREAGFGQVRVQSLLVYGGV